jgi:hypothetical protein
MKQENWIFSLGGIIPPLPLTTILKEDHVRHGVLEIQLDSITDVLFNLCFI